MQPSILTRIGTKAAAAALFAQSPLGAGPAAAQTRHHITMGPGLTKMLGDDLKHGPGGTDFTNAGYGALAYRFSMNATFDITIDAYGLMSKDTYQGVDLTVQNSYLGPGVRWTPSGAVPRPFLQVNVLFVDEEADAERNGISHLGSKGQALGHLPAQMSHHDRRPGAPHGGQRAGVTRPPRQGGPRGLAGSNGGGERALRSARCSPRARDLRPGNPATR